jgi:hypothetical protein
MKGPRGIAKEVTVEKSRTVVYHFTADDLRKRLRLPDDAVLRFELADAETGHLTLHAEVKG